MKFCLNFFVLLLLKKCHFYETRTTMEVVRNAWSAHSRNTLKLPQSLKESNQSSNCFWNG